MENIKATCDPGQPLIQTNPLFPVGPAEQLFIAGASVFEITIFEPPLQRVTILGINLPDPDTFGPYDRYEARLFTTNAVQDVIDTVDLVPTLDNQNWVGTTFLEFGGTLFPIFAEVRPVSDTRVGPAILEGQIF